MDQSTLPASWRSRSAAVLPLAFLQSLAFGFIELPAIYLFRELECERYASGLPPHLPEDDICRDPAVQKAYSIDVAIYLALSTICSIAVSGPFGRLSDMRGRKIVMSSAACLNAIGDFWLFLSALLPAIRNPYSLMLSAFIKGMGGSFSVVQAAQSAFVADTSSSTTRSFYLGLALVMFWIASAIAPLGVSFLLREDHYAACFGIASGCWIIYLLYSVFIIQETRVPSGQKNDQANQTATPTSQNENISQPEPRRAFFQSLTEPLVFIFRDPTLRWLALTTLSMLIAIGAFSVLVVYCDFMFGMRASEAGIIASIMSMARAFSVLCVLPAFLALYRKLYANRVYKLNNTTHSNGASETSPLLAEHDTQASQNNTPSTDQTSASAAQELLVARVCFLIDAVGMILISLSRNPAEIMISTTLGALGAPAAPSVQALVTLAASPSEVGRVLAGFSIIESAGVALRNPILFGTYGATLEVAPKAIWYFASGLFVFCAFTVMWLKPARFIKKKVTDGDVADNHQ